MAQRVTTLSGKSDMNLRPRSHVVEEENGLTNVAVRHLHMLAHPQINKYRIFFINLTCKERLLSLRKLSTINTSLRTRIHKNNSL